jgi:hypothetical protein
MWLPRLTMVLLTSAISVGVGLNPAPLPPRRVNIDDARMLVYEAIKKESAGAELIESPRDFDPDFYFFTASWPNPAGSPIVGYFAVNPLTADVWDAWTCKRMASASLKRLQRVVRRRLGIGGGEFHRLSLREPMC